MVKRKFHYHGSTQSKLLTLNKNEASPPEPKSLRLQNQYTGYSYNLGGDASSSNVVNVAHFRIKKIPITIRV